MRYPINETYFYAFAPNSESTVKVHVSVGEIIRDDLTGNKVMILKIFQDENQNVGLEIDNGYLAGSRYPWEITAIE